MVDEEKQVSKTDLALGFATHAQPIITLDAEKYQHWLDDSDLSKDQKQEFLQALWSIVVAYVEMGFGVHPLQEVCGQDGFCEGQLSQTFENEVDSGKSKDKKEGADHSDIGLK
ncbi:hypothetical protein [Sneathiella sp.]|uniref:hypothetical protein n=1 Tax=Sneathiella sp. TaxID=1964365 RepID=UPI00262CF56A|nr:hypothetical protein [Sneathiella sp.]MDF2365628.1 hypothetical protein [Sneathiella sp.]